MKVELGNGGWGRFWTTWFPSVLEGDIAGEERVSLSEFSQSSFSNLFYPIWWSLQYQCNLNHLRVGLLLGRVKVLGFLFFSESVHTPLLHHIIALSVNSFLNPFFLCFRLLFLVFRDCDLYPAFIYLLSGMHLSVTTESSLFYATIYKYNSLTLSYVLKVIWLDFHRDPWHNGHSSQPNFKSLLQYMGH